MPTQRSFRSGVLLAAVLALTPGAALAEVAARAEDARPRAVGSTLPGAMLSSVTGEPVALDALARERGALLVFYRGGW